MPVKTLFVGEQELRNVALPQFGGRYTVIPHGYIIDKVKTELQKNGLQVTGSTYRATINGEIAQGIYKLSYSEDPDMAMMFAWSNSYNKTMSFRCAVGAQVFVCMNGVVSGDMGQFSRRHTGSALSDVDAQVVNQLGDSLTDYRLLIQDKEILKNIILTPKEKGTILGRLFAEEEILTLTQTGIVKREMFKPSFQYNADKDSAWSMYNHITLSLKESHPLNYLSDHRRVHEFFMKEYGGKISPMMVTEQNKVEEQVTETSAFGVFF